jgi:hypothetical protein
MKKYSILDILQTINKDLFVAAFARNFIQNEQHITSVLNDLIHGIPIGSIVLCRAVNISHRCFLQEINLNLKQDATRENIVDATHLVLLDGQQRIQSLYAIFFGKIIKDNNTFDAYIDITKENLSGHIQLLASNSDKNLFRLKNLIESKLQPTGHQLAVEIYSDIIDREIDKDIEGDSLFKTIRDNLENLISVIHEKNKIHFQILDRNLSQRDAIDIFISLNKF